MKILIKFLIFAVSLLVVLQFTTKIQAVMVAEQTQGYGSNLQVWQTIQELGNNLSGTAQNFTFRVSTSVSHSYQFDYTAQNTRIYDKDNGSSSIAGCVPSGVSTSDQLRGLTFSTSGVPDGYEDVTIDFSCRNYSFISGHRYLIKVSNANNFGKIYFSAATYSGTSNDYFTGGGARYAYDNGTCNAVSYVWNSSISNSGCNIWTTKQDDLYFILNNSTPVPTPTPTPTPSPLSYPVIFIPGIGGSEFQTTQDIIWSKDNGHGGTFSHAYPGGEKVWVNETEAALIGDDDYFDILKLKPDGVTPEASLTLTGNLTSFGYPDIDSFFEGLGYVKNTSFFVYPYDWRKDIATTKDGLDTLVEEAKQKSGMPKVNIVAHSMGGLVARNYIADSGKAAKVGKLIELGVPHLGSVDALKSLMYGNAIKKRLLGIISLGITSSEVKDISKNLPTIFQLLPSNYYYQFYNDASEKPYPFRDDRDIDSDAVTGTLSFTQTKTLLNNLSYNMTVFNLAESLHNFLDPLLNQTSSVNLYEIVGTSQPTLGQIRETWWINWPINTLPRYEEIYINGDNTVPVYSASLKSDTLDLSAGARIYYVDQKHSDLVTGTGAAMQTVKVILQEGDSFPVEVKDEKIVLEGQQISVDQDAEIDLYDESNNHTGLKPNGDPETNITGTFYDSLGTSKHIFIKKSSPRVTVKVKSGSTSKTNVKIRQYTNDTVSKTILYREVSIPTGTEAEFQVDPLVDTAPNITVGGQVFAPTTETTGTAVLDSTPPTTLISLSGTKDSSGNYTGDVTVTLTGSDTGAGVLQIEYSIDRGQTVNTYTSPFIISSPGITTLQVISTDNLGNQESPQTVNITINSPTTSNSSASSTTSTSQDNSSTLTSPGTFPLNRSYLPQVLGIETPAPAVVFSPGGPLPVQTTDAPQEVLLLVPLLVLLFNPQFLEVLTIFTRGVRFRKPTKN